MSQIKYKFVGSQNFTQYNKTKYVKIPEEYKTIEEIERYLKLYVLNMGLYSYSLQFDHDKRAFKRRGGA